MKSSNSLHDNPYLQSRALWNDVYGNLELKYRYSQWIIIMMGILLLTAMLGIIILSQRSSIKPYPFIIHGNEVITVNESSLTEIDAIKSNLAIFLSKEYIKNARLVSVDSKINTQNQISVYSMSQQQALQAAKKYFKTYDPNTIAMKKINQIVITSVLRKSNNTIDVRWQEEWYNSTQGEYLQTTNYLAELTFDFSTPSNDPIVLQNNPLGFYVKQLVWDEERF